MLDYRTNKKLSIYCVLVWLVCLPLIATSASFMSCDMLLPSSSERPIITLTSNDQESYAIRDVSCSDIMLSSSQTTSPRIYLKNPSVWEYINFNFANPANGAFDVLGYRIFGEDQTDKRLVSWKMDSNRTLLNSTSDEKYSSCDSNSGIFAIVKTGEYNPDSYPYAQQQKVGTKNCLFQSIEFYCDSTGSPLSNTSHKCLTEVPSEVNHSSASVEPVEECQKNQDGSCVNTSVESKTVAVETKIETEADTKAKMETQKLYNDLVASQNGFNQNNCEQYDAGEKERVCSGYQEVLRKFKELNTSIKVNCSSGNENLKQRPLAAEQPPVPYSVNCL
jgi:hypothetical protein